MEILNKEIPKKAVKALLFDFDGTISTLRCGWEKTMRALMLEYVDAGENKEKLIDDYINESTGIQTIYQMQWLAEHSYPDKPKDPWWYKDEYNRMLMEEVGRRRDSLTDGSVTTETYLMKGSTEFLREMRRLGIKMYVASGTDHPDVLKEAEALGVLPYFDELAGAPVRQASCSKEAVLKRLIEDYGLIGDEVAVIGDGKVEIALGKKNGARTLGLATDEVNRCGVNPVKRERLIKAGADVIDGDFTDMQALKAFLGLE